MDQHLAQPAALGASLEALAAASFEQLVQIVDQIGANRGDPGVIRLYRSWIALQGGTGRHLPAAWFNLGVELTRAGQTEDAILAYRSAMALRPYFAEAAINLGLQLELTGAPEEALACWAGALQPDAARTGLMNHRARLLEQRGRLVEAEQVMRTSLLTNPQQPDVIQHWVHVRQKLCLWPVLQELPGLTQEELTLHCGPLGCLALTDNVALQTLITSGWIARKTHAVAERLSPPLGYGHRRIRLGYMSSDFCRHAMSYLIAELFERHDRSQFELFGYCTSIDDGSEIRARVMAGFDHFRIIRTLDDAAAAQLIRADEIDILIDLNGLTAGSRLQILRFRPAPVQATYLGFIGPVPLPELDYVLCDDIVVPPSEAVHYKPAPLAIPGLYQANDSRRAVGTTAGRAANGLPEDQFVFCCFSNHYKITEEMFAAWMRILAGSGQSVLWLVTDNPWSGENMRQRAAMLGVDPARIVLSGRVGPEEYIARLGLADMFLDTFPYNAGTIASDALRMGLPVLTRCGHSFASRMAGRLLVAMGADAAVAMDLPSYIEKAITFATDAGQYAALKAVVSGERWAATIGDIGTFTRSFEATLRSVAVGVVED